MKLNNLINNLKLVFTSDETILSKYNNAHCDLVKNMNECLYEIWEYSKSGNVAAHDFMYSKLHDRLVQFKLDFVNDDIPNLHKRATYGAYKDIMKEVNPLLHSLRRERTAA